ncbi:hypothetical protein Cgig2_014668 [Carnegiea gigantea]|uniref:RNA polymerase II C-terminal domain phosphatase-like n=1 Tax=Carnegiea gigantea TaxID=171969 RepID=A0A9Q1L1F7_9CARY|nr:hypothetical protein Cgig2_014668 [Carnegiea gigantea]
MGCPVFGFTQKWAQAFGMDFLFEKAICPSLVLAPALPCPHPGFTESVCIVCNKPKPECGDPPTIPFAYIEPGLSLTVPEITRLRDANLRALIRRKKLHLVLDLDHTLLHSTLLDNLTLEQAQHLKTKGSLFRASDGDRVVKLRPGAREFLEKVRAMFDLSIFTMGVWWYAREMADLLDPEGFLFGGRLISREDCLMPKQKTLDVVLAHERVVLIVDDTEEVWRHNHKDNLIKIAPYNFFIRNDTPQVDLDLLGEVKSASRITDDEDEEDEEFIRVLRTLTEVYNGFYGNDCELENYGDVREVLKRLQMNSISRDGKRKRQDDCDIKL